MSRRPPSRSVPSNAAPVFAKLALLPQLFLVACGGGSAPGGGTSAASTLVISGSTIASISPAKVTAGVGAVNRWAGFGAVAVQFQNAQVCGFHERSAVPPSPRTAKVSDLLGGPVGRHCFFMVGQKLELFRR